jgi:DUF4097 and DUF4098 domain-containing protein YvlB
MRNLAIILLAALVALPVTAAVVPIDEAHAISPDGTVSLEIIFGSVTVRGGGGDSVRITGSYDERYVEVEIDASDRGVSIEVEPIRDSKGKHFETTELEIEMPAGARLEMESISAELDVSNVSGEIEVESVSGRVSITGSELDTAISTVSSAVSVEASRALRRGSFETISGKIEVRAPLAAGGRYSFESVSGDVALILPADSSARFEIESFSGSITNDLTGEQPEKTSEYLPSKELRFKVGDGDARVSMESLSGRIRLLRD